MTNVFDQASGDRFAIYNCDTVEFTAGMPDNSVDFSIYSPPFSSLYTYSESERDMGNVENDAAFFDAYSHLVRELLRVTKPGRLTAIHVKDLVFYSNSSEKGDRGLRPFSDGCTAAHLAAGWTFHSRITIERDPVREMQKTKADRLLFKHFREDAARSGQGLPEYLLIFRAWKPGMEEVPPVLHDFMRWREWRGHDLPEGVTEEWVRRGFMMDENFERQSALSLWQQWANSVWRGLPETDTLNVRVVRDDDAEKHLCPMPLNITDRGVRLWSNAGETVYSPFAGIGSEGVASLRADRRFIGTELKGAYFKQAVRFLQEAEQNAGSLLDVGAAE